mmetsp:Transcript_15393/g.22905  ORF Transcript_15393/g.22905 Transcript_15393/m.22905 type:complete len:83 (-) Transcript_15393:724-972(-)
MKNGLGRESKSSWSGGGGIVGVQPTSQLVLMQQMQPIVVQNTKILKNITMKIHSKEVLSTPIRFHMIAHDMINFRVVVKHDI